jgi:hypothetical protein
LRERGQFLTIGKIASAAASKTLDPTDCAGIMRCTSGRSRGMAVMPSDHIRGTLLWNPFI